MHSSSAFNISGTEAEAVSSQSIRPVAEAGNNDVSEPTQERRVRLVLVDELGLFRESLARFLASEPGFEVIGQCGTSVEALLVLKNSTADVVLLDFEVGAEHANDFICAARQAGYQGHFLIVAGAPDIRKSAVALKVGASGIFLKSEAPERLLKAIKVVADDGAWVDPKIIQLLAEQFIDRYPQFTSSADERSNKPLDERERNVLLGILGGLPNRKIGSNLGISESAVKNVIQRLFTKAGVRTRSQLVRAALEGSLGAAQEFMKHRPSESGGGGGAKSRARGQSHTPLPTVNQSHD
jgi:two-component system nitrate/nitrite response regulator NarL